MAAEIVPFQIERQEDGELRISDIELSDRLGYSEIRSFRRVIRNNTEDLQMLGLLHRIGAKGAGRTEQVFWLNRSQAIHAIYRSDTPAAKRLAIELTRAFDDLLSKTQVALPIREWFQLNIISEQVSVWEREFPAGFFDNLHRVLGLVRPGRNNHSNCGHFINRYVYSFLFGELGLDVIREANPTDDDYNRSVRHHQVLQNKHKPALRQHIDRVGVMLSLSISLSHFDDQFNRAFSKPDTQIGFVFRESPRIA